MVGGLRLNLLGLVAGIAFLVVDTNHAATIRAFPPFLLVFQELLNAICLNMSQILNHAHSIFFSIAVIQRF